MRGFSIQLMHPVAKALECQSGPACVSQPQGLFFKPEGEFEHSPFLAQLLVLLGALRFSLFVLSQWKGLPRAENVEF